MMDTNGDDHLSGFDLKLWQLHHYLILRWHIYTVFKYNMWNVRTQTPSIIEWFIPAGHPAAEEVAKFLDHELESEALEPIDMGDVVIPGRKVLVHVCSFRGVEPYMERADVEELAQEMMRILRENVAKRKEE